MYEKQSLNFSSSVHAIKLNFYCCIQCQTDDLLFSVTFDVIFQQNHSFGCYYRTLKASKKWKCVKNDFCLFIKLQIILNCIFQSAIKSNKVQQNRIQNNFQRGIYPFFRKIQFRWNKIIENYLLVWFEVILCSLYNYAAIELLLRVLVGQHII